MKLSHNLILGFLLLLYFIESSQGEEALPVNKKVKIQYRRHSEVNFTGNTVQGKLRMPEVFYIFQRKRSQGHQVIRPPQFFHDHKLTTRNLLEESLSR